jgi:octaprenyl-diphosphate synthase
VSQRSVSQRSVSQRIGSTPTPRQIRRACGEGEVSAASSVTAGQAASRAVLRELLYGPIEDQLAEVETLLRREMQSPYEDVAVLLRHGVALGGKRLRPAIHLLVAQALGAPTQANVVIATVLEMVHTATLVHDDVLDHAETRRHVATINAQWDEHTSILLGDYLFAQSFRLAATLENTRTCQWVGEAARRVCQGELRQVLGRSEWDMEEASYVEIIRGKTAELCRVACALAAAEAGCDQVTVERLARYGDHLGVAFQIADDYLDVWGDDAEVGKTLGTDLEQGKVTLPVIRLLQTLGSQERQQVLELLNSDPAGRLAALQPWLAGSDAMTYTLAAARRYRDWALESVQPLCDGPAKRCLEAIAEFSIRRSF